MYLHMITDSHNSCTLGMTTKDIDNDDFGDHYKNKEREHVVVVVVCLFRTVLQGYLTIEWNRSHKRS